MRRFAVAAFLVIFATQPSGAALATGDKAPISLGLTTLLDSMRSLIASTVAASSGIRPRVQHTPVPRRSMTDYRNPHRYARLIPKPDTAAKFVSVARPIDLVKLSRERHGETRLAQLPTRRLVGISKPKVPRHGLGPTLLTPSVTGILPWWTYQSRDIPGAGQAMVNVVNLNFLVQSNDIDIPEGDLDLAFRRTYNSFSQHNVNGDDGSTPSVYGNRWTNNLDVHLGWSSTGQNVGIVSVYTGDGARLDYSCTINQLAVCTSQTTGVHDLLATTQLGGNGIACQLQWTKKSGTTYIFDAPYPDCTSNDAGYYGRLLAIYGRNLSFYLTLAYSWSPNDSSPENISKIVVTHQPDGTQLTMHFGQIAGTSITELMNIVRPDNEQVDYDYDTTGEILAMDKPGNMPILPSGEHVPTAYADGTPIPTGNLPELFDIKSPGLMEACGPRAAIGILTSGATEGACVDFDYSNRQLIDWWTRGVLNPTPQDGVLTPSAIQPGVNGGFTQWDDTTFFNGIVQGNCPSGNMAEMSDAVGHDIDWCYDASSRVTETSVAVNTTSSLTTSDTWDNNNDLVSTTDTRGYTTNMGYDSNGNVVEVSLPQQSTSKGTLTPTSFYDYDQYNNLIKYCDPANNNHNSFVTPPTDVLCQTYGSAYAAYTYSSDGQNGDPKEQYGCVTATMTQSGYQKNITYGPGGPCGNGLPTKAKAAKSISQDDGSSRTPTQSFSYNTTGALSSYDPGEGAWTLGYSTGGMNRLISRSDPDNVTSHTCYNLDGSVFYSETANQNVYDGGASESCPTKAQLIAGTATPAPYAVNYRYDADGNVLTQTSHHNCNTSMCGSNGTTNVTPCNNLNVTAGTTCNFYDGLGRVVEVKKPYDPSFDLYVNPWITRYLYDLSGGQYAFGTTTVVAYGNLFETEELLPGSTTGTVTDTWGTSGPTPIGNTTYVPVKATAFDAADRPTAKYSYVGQQLNTETLTWDTSPIGPNVVGLLGKDCNGLSNSQCQRFNYLPDGEKLTVDSNDGSVFARTYAYDPDGRVTSIQSAAYTNAQQYSYDVDGNLSTATDPSNAVNQANAVSSPAVLTHNYYPDNTLASIDVASSALTQTGLFQYSYQADGRLHTEQLNDTSLQGNQTTFGKTKLLYTYSPGGRITERDEQGVGANSSSTTFSYDLSQTTPTGLLQSETTPANALSSMEYTADGELYQFDTGGNTAYYTYTLRGEHGCGIQTCAYIGAKLANGVAVQQLVLSRGISGQYQWDDGMGVVTGIGETGCQPSAWCPASAWSFDKAGRQTASSGPIGSEQVIGGISRTYDAENHLLTTTSNLGAISMTWGPNGHPLTIGTAGANETLHWDGGQMLFATRKPGAQAILDDIKVDAQGDVLPQDTSYPGLTFYERGPGDAVMGCHNHNGAVTSGIGDVWGRFGQSPQKSGPCYQSNGPAMPISIDWYGTSLVNWSSTPPLLGQGGVLGMLRADGITDDFDTLQGVRAYDNTAGEWTTPDAYAGIVEEPASQKSYMWNDNNPVTYNDPSGYDAEFNSKTGMNVQPIATDSSVGVPDLLSLAVCAAVDTQGDCFSSGTAVQTSGANKAVYKSLSAAAEGAQQAATDLGLKPAAGYEIGCAVYCTSPTKCGYGDFQIGTPENTLDESGVDLSPYKADAAFGVGIWHMHPDGSTELSTYGHDADNNATRRAYPWLKGFTIYTTYQGLLHQQTYGGLVPAEEGKVYVPPSLVPPQ